MHINLQKIECTYVEDSLRDRNTGQNNFMRDFHFNVYEDQTSYGSKERAFNRQRATEL
jgi:hypothetical protein